MKKKETLTSQSFTCSNPNCGRVYANPIIVQDLNSKNEFSYTACPYCLTEVETEKASKVRKTRRKQKKKEARKQGKIEEKKAHSKKSEIAQHLSTQKDECPKYFGYLSQRSRKKEIPEECITCKKIVQCMFEKAAN